VNDATLNDHELAADLATRAGQLLVQLREEMFDAGSAPWRVMDAGDMASHHFLMSELAQHRPGDSVLSEEGRDDRRRLTADRVWIVDPLDGTNEYGEYPRHDWAVHVALWENGALTAGAVSLPAVGRTLHTGDTAGLPNVDGRRARIVTSRMRTPYIAAIIAQAIDADGVRLGSAGAKAMAVVLGEADVYAHAGGMYEWDSAAPVAVAQAAGFHVSRIDGSPFIYNQSDPWMPDLLICRPEYAERALAAIARGR
jgi:3'(2'), 5'-bisphosphate nucleotidase